MYVREDEAKRVVDGTQLSKVDDIQVSLVEKLQEKQMAIKSNPSLTLSSWSIFL